MIDFDLKDVITCVFALFFVISFLVGIGFGKKKLEPIPEPEEIEDNFTVEMQIASAQFWAELEAQQAHLMEFDVDWHKI